MRAAFNVMGVDGPVLLRRGRVDQLRPVLFKNVELESTGPYSASFLKLVLIRATLYGVGIT